jgi:diguanylate cyclase (GGDEF)-like protein
MDRLQHALRRLDRREGIIAVLFLDLDRFKLINDSVGHLVGDAVLLQMAERLRAFLRPEDTLARLGGDEFAIVVEDMTKAEEAVALGARIIEAGRAPFVVGDEQFVCTTSVGIAVTKEAQRSAEGLLQEADLALYRAKDKGRDRAEVFDEDLRTRAVGRLGTERMLRRAIDEDRLRVEFQPIIDLRTMTTVGAEALVRVWDADEAALITAESFIDVAEETGLLASMDDWVLAQVIEQATAWRDRFVETGFADVAINITARHLADAGFARSVIDDLAAHGLPSGALQIEVTERVLLEASNSAMSGLKVLRDAGVKVGLDDFGTGYSSLSYLRLFPLDFVKIDRSFIQEMSRSVTAPAIVASIIDLSHALGMGVVAEGVETQSQLAQLVALGCDRAQGFLFATAGPPEVIERRVLRPEMSERS